MKQLLWVVVIFVGSQSINMAEEEQAGKAFILPPQILETILNESKADSIQSINTLVFRKLGSNAVLVVECELGIASIADKTVAEGVMHSTFTFISRNGSKLIYSKVEINPLRVLEKTFKLPEVPKESPERPTLKPL